MINLLIVDDEKSTREGLCTCIDWKEAGISIIGTAANGIEALQLADQIMPQIVITDVKMPRKNGVDLAYELKERSPGIKIIFISGYSDQEYIKSAFKCDAVDYIFKPVDISELRDVVDKAVKQIDEDKRKQLHQTELEQKLADSMPLLRNKFCMDLLQGHVFPKEELERQIAYFHLPFVVSDWFVVFVCVTDPKNTDSFENPEESYAIEPVIDSMMSDHGICVELDHGKYACIYTLKNTDRFREDVMRFTGGIHRHLEKNLGIHNTIAIGTLIKNIENLNLSLLAATDTLEKRFVYGEDCIITTEEEENAGSIVPPVPQTVLEMLSSSLLSGDILHSTEILHGRFDILRSYNKADIASLRSNCLQIASCLVSAAHRVPNQTEGFMHQILDLNKDVYQALTLEDVEQKIIGATNLIVNEVCKNRPGRSDDLVRRIRAIIDMRYQEDLSVASIAGEVFMTPAYICLLFKQETGMTINQYLTDVRIRHAKTALQNGSNKVSDVALMVGYHDQKYFSKLFKKHVGVKPSEYK